MSTEIPMGRHELFEFAYDIFKKAITLVSIDDRKVINIDDEIVKEIISQRLQKTVGVKGK